jgi:hypothetical protein
MAQVIKIRRGTKAQLDAYGPLQQGEMGFCTDTKEVYIGDGSTNVLVGRVMSGTLANRPNPTGSGRFYFATNENVLYVDVGTWQKLTIVNLDELPDGSTYGKVLKEDITSGHVNKVSDGTKTATAAQIRDHIDNAAIHRQINDSGTGPTDLWSAQKIRNEIELAKRGMEFQDSVKSRTTTAPPSSPTVGDRYIVPVSGASGAWSGQANKIAEWNGSSWSFYTPAEGWTVYVDIEAKLYSWNGSAWVVSGAALQNIVAGNGLSGGGQADTVTLNVGAGNGITVSADAVAVKPYNGINVDSNGVSVKAYNGITVNGNGVSVNIDNDSIVYDSANGNRLMVAVIDGGTF